MHIILQQIMLIGMPILFTTYPKNIEELRFEGLSFTFWTAPPGV
jgi:hypothetical protein